MALQIDDNTEFNYMVPVSPADGNLIAINRQSGASQLVFYQVRKQSGEHIDKVDVIAAIAMGVEDLRRYRDAITENLELSDKSEK
jgi:hypothetical protein